VLPADPDAVSALNWQQLQVLAARLVEMPTPVVTETVMTNGTEPHLG
jgi:hypothetical protein